MFENAVRNPIGVYVCSFYAVLSVLLYCLPYKANKLDMYSQRRVQGCRCTNTGGRGLKYPFCRF